MGHPDKKPEINSISNSKSIMSISAHIFLYIISLAIFATFFAQSFSWLLNGVDQFRYIGETRQMSSGQTATSSMSLHSIFGLLALPSILTWLFGIIAAKIGDSFVDFCWLIIKQYGKKAWNKIKCHLQN